MKNNLRQVLLSEELIKEKKFWEDKIDESILQNYIPFDFHDHSCLDRRECRIIIKDVYDKLVQFSNNSDLSMYFILLTCFKVLIYKYTGVQEVPVGSLPYNVPFIKDSINNIVIIRNVIRDDFQFDKYLQSVRKTVLEAYENQNYPLWKFLDRKGDGDDRTISNVVTAFTGIHDKKYLDGLNPNLIILFTKLNECIEVVVSYRSGYYQENTIKMFLDRYASFIEKITENPRKEISDIQIISKEEMNLLRKFEQTYSEYPKDKTIHQIFEEQVEKAPYNIALVHKNEKISYNELDKKANQLAMLLKYQGVVPDSIVGVMTERSIETVISILGILKAGGAYLPIDPEYPEERIRFMLEDSETEILLTQSWLSKKVEFEGKKIILDENDFSEDEVEKLEVVNNSKDLAYLIYTSGSTDRPKGTLIEHKSVIRLVKNTDYIEFDDSLVIMQTGSIAFDASTFEIWGALLNGGKLVLVGIDVITNAQRLKYYIEKWNVNTMWCTSILYNQLIQTDISVFNNLKNLLIGGEKISEKHVYLLKEKNKSIKLINGYGPTENTTFTTTFEVIGEYDTIPIGKPIKNTQIYILNNQCLCGIGIPGELCVGGDGLARGYLNQPELTAEKFVNHPFILGERIYRTGDLARWLPDGNVEFLGRIDHQVKIRGFRIELGEVEQALLGNSDIKEATVLAKGNERSGKSLIAYVVSDIELDKNKVVDCLKSKLPEYMIPSQIIQLKKLPTNQNGKIDRSVLEERADERCSSAIYIPPRTEDEKAMVQAWKEVFNMDEVGVCDDFFELGGDSLKAGLIAAKMYEAVRKNIKISDILQGKIIQKIVGYLRDSCDDIELKAYSDNLMDVYPLSSEQKQMYILNQMNSDSTNYNINVVIKLRGGVDRQIIEDIFKVLITRHEILRTSFHTEGPIQRIHKECNFNIGYYEMEVDGESEIIERFIKPFDLKLAPLMRVNLLCLSPLEYRLVVDIHHIIADGTSVKNLMDEFAALYNSQELKDVTLQYKDYAIWQSEMDDKGLFNIHQNYWLSELKGRIPVVDLLADYERPRVRDHRGKSFRFHVDVVLLENLKSICQEKGATMYMGLISIFYILLHKYTGQNELIIGTPVSGRTRAGLEKTIGMFNNTLPIRVIINSDMIFDDVLEVVKQKTLDALEHQEYQFQHIVESIRSQYDLSRNPLFDIFFDFQDVVGDEMRLNGLEVEFIDYDSRVSKFDLSLNISSSLKFHDYQFSLQYSCSLFDEQTIIRIKNHLISILKELYTDKNKKIKNMDLIGKEKRMELLSFQEKAKINSNYFKTLHEYFEEKVALKFDEIALIMGQKNMTYGELNIKSNCLAHLLRKKGVRPEMVIGIETSRSFDMIIGILAILKAGGAYLPISTFYPEERKKYILSNSETQILLCEKRQRNCNYFEGEIIEIQGRETECFDGTNLEHWGTINNLVYVMYTSGSTGKPKGVMLEHRNIVNLLLFMEEKYPLSFNDVYILKTSYTFDVSVTELFGWFIGEGKLVIMEENGEKDPEKIINVIREYHVTHINFIPSMLIQIIEFMKVQKVTLESLKYVFSAGEAIIKDTVINFYRLMNCRLINLYGPTEAAVYATVFSTNPFIDYFRIPIGKPISNTQIFIIDDFDKLQLMGVKGEICISGEGIARGYLNNKNLTLEKFFNNPNVSNIKMYRTGDLGRWLPNGNIEYLGRIDEQVKIRGFRIELGEIESVIREWESTKDCAVIAREDSSGDEAIYAYVVSNEELSLPLLRDRLEKALPEYMVPTYMAQIDLIPVTRNGKLDKKALPGIEVRIETEYVTSRTEIDEKLCRIFGEILDIEQVGIKDNFFDLGGNSLKIIYLQMKLAALGINIELSDLYRLKNIANISDYIKKKENLINAEAKKENLLNVRVDRINNIKPVNEIFFKDCFYTAFFPAYIYYGRSMEELLSNSVCVYSFTSEKDRLVHFIDIIEEKEFINDRGIELKQLEHSSGNIITIIKESIRKSRPIILAIDPYFNPERSDTYLLKHMNHFILIFGVNEEQEMFEIVDHTRFDTMDYDYRTISYKSLLEIYKGTVQEFGSSYTGVLEMIDKTLKKAVPSNKEILRQYILNMNKVQKNIDKGLRQLKEYEEYLQKVISTELDQQIEYIIDNISEIINAKRSEEFLLSSIQECSEELIQQTISEIIKKWEEIRALFVKYSYSKVIPLKAIREKVENIATIICLEKSKGERLKRLL